MRGRREPPPCRRFHARSRIPPASRSGRCLRDFALQEFQQLLPYLAAQLPGLAGIARTDQGAQFNRIRGHVGDLQSRHLAVPMLALVNDLVEPAAQTMDRHAITDPEEDSPDLRGALIGPVLEGL